ncbi:ABC transporter substrate-binding protein [Candidatus Bathyarchaeota archaeon]|nr:ABC transporter substrate-binding protein [Candidatus Bathyarchaeota archaeon]
MNKKISLTILMLAILVLALPLSVTIPAKAQEKKEVMIVLHSEYPPPPGGHYNPYVPGAAVGGFSHMGLVLESLAHWFLLNNTYVPWLATSWEVKGDNFIVHLRKGVTWHDGTKFTSKDVVSTFLILKMMKHLLWTFIDDVKAEDDYTVVFHVKKPSYLVQNYILTQLITPYSIFGKFTDRILAGEDIDKVRADFVNFRPEKFIGTGPFILESCTESETIFTKNPNYWFGTDKLYIDKVKCIRSTSDAFAARMMLTGVYDWETSAGTLIPGVIDEIQKKYNCTVVVFPGYGYHTIWFNPRVYPLNMKEVRWAIAMAINKTTAGLAGVPKGTFFVDPKCTGLSKYVLDLFVSKEAYESLRDYTYNPKKAAEILESLGFKKGDDGIWVTPNGTKLEFTWTIPAGYSTAKVGVQAADQLKEFGIKITIKAVEPPTCYSLVRKGDFEIASWFGGGGPFPYFAVSTWTYDFLPKVTGEHPGPGFTDTYEWPPGSGKYVNVTELAIKLNEGYDPLAHKDEIETLMRIFNEYLPYLPVESRGNPVYFNYERFDWPSPVKPDGTLDPGVADPFRCTLAWLFVHGLVKPKGVAVVSPAAKAAEEAKAAAAKAAEAAAKAIEPAKAAATKAAEAASMAESAFKASQEAKAAAEAAKAAVESLVTQVWAGIGVLAVILIVIAVAIMRKISSLGEVG